METEKAKKPKLPAYKQKQIQQKKEPAQALKDLFGSLKALTLINDLMLAGSWPYQHIKRLDVAFDYINALHGETLKSAISHPDAHLIPELAERIAQMKQNDELKEEIEKRKASNGQN